MAGPIRDDSAGSYGTWNNDDLSWLDYIKANASDGGNALANLGRNLVQGFSPIGSSPEGNMAFQVPPIVSGIADSYSRLAGTPSQPGNAYNLSGVPELDAPIQQDMSNVLLSLYGGNAVSGLARGMKTAEASIPPIRAYHGTGTAFDRFGTPTVYATTNPAMASKYADMAGGVDGPSVIPVDMSFRKILNTADFEPPWKSGVGFNEIAKRDGYDGISWGDGVYSAVEPGTVKSPLTGETLFSDTGKPSILGSAMAGAGEQKPISIMKTDEGKNWGVYHARVGDDIAGYADYGVLPNAGVVRGVGVDPAFQRQGIASALHGRIQDDLGLPLTPDNTLSQAGYDFWQASYPEALRDHKPNGNGYWIDDVNRDMSKGVPEWRMSGGPSRPDDVLWSRATPLPQYQDEDLPDWLRF